MGPGAGLIVGVPFIVLTLALLVIFRRERLRREAGLPAANPRLPFYRVVLVALLLFIGYLVVAILAPLIAPSGFGPPPN